MESMAKTIKSFPEWRLIRHMLKLVRHVSMNSDPSTKIIYLAGSRKISQVLHRTYQNFQTSREKIKYRFLENSGYFPDAPSDCYRD